MQKKKERVSWEEPSIGWDFRGFSKRPKGKSKGMEKRAWCGGGVSGVGVGVQETGENRQQVLDLSVCRDEESW